MPDWTTRKAQDASAETAPATVDADIFGWDSDEEVDAEVAALTASPVAFRGYKSASKARPSAPPPTRCTTPPRTGRRRSPRPPTDKAPPAVKPRALRPAPSRGARRVLVASSRANAPPPPPPPLKKDLLRSLAAAADDAPTRSIADKLHPLAAPPTPPRAEADEAAAGPPSTVSRSDRGSIASPAARFAAARAEPPRRRRPRRVDRSDPVALFAHRQADWERQRRAARRRRRAAA